jgi:hypothetical protein
MFAIVASELALFHILPFATGAATGALAGYTQMIPQGRPLLNEMLPLFSEAPVAAIRAIPALKQLTPENYGTQQLGNLLDFVLGRTGVDDAAFGCVVALFDWLPRDLWTSRGSALFDGALRALRREAPPPAAFACVAKCAEALFFANRRDFIDAVPHFTAIALTRATDLDRETADSARAALVTCTSAAGMHQTAQAIRGAVAVEDFIAEIAGPFTAEASQKVIEALVAAAQTTVLEAKITVARVLAFAVHAKRHATSGVHLKLAGLLTDNDPKVKVAVLKAIQQNPPNLA